MAKLKTALCDVLGIEHPIIQAGMGWGTASPIVAQGGEEDLMDIRVAGNRQTG